MHNWYEVEMSQCSVDEWVDKQIYHIFQTIRRTYPPKFGRKMGVRLTVQM